MKVLVVVDYQNDFVNGTLGFPGAEKLDDKIAERITDTLSDGGKVLFTLDTHSDSYLSTREGKNLPITHCVKGTEGFNLYGKTGEVAAQNRNLCLFLEKKDNFGYHGFKSALGFSPSEIEVVGLVTNICVITVALGLQTEFSQAKITVFRDLCDSFDKELHQKALDVMKG